jgi:leucine dehydrogenase
VFEHAEKIYTTCLNILNLAEREKISSQEAAIKLSEKRIADIGRVRMTR